MGSVQVAPGPFTGHSGEPGAVCQGSKTRDSAGPKAAPVGYKAVQDVLQAAPGAHQEGRISHGASGIRARSSSWATVLESVWEEQGQPQAEAPEQLGELSKQNCPRMSQAELRGVRGYFWMEESCSNHRAVLRAQPPPWSCCGRAAPAPTSIHSNLHRAGPAAFPLLCEV